MDRTLQYCSKKILLLMLLIIDNILKNIGGRVVSENFSDPSYPVSSVLSVPSALEEPSKKTLGSVFPISSQMMSRFILGSDLARKVLMAFILLASS